MMAGRMRKAITADSPPTIEQALDEAAADYAGRMMEDGKVLDRFIEAHKENRTLLEKVRDAIRAIVRKLTGAEKKQAQTAEGKLTAALEAAARRAETLQKRQGDGTMNTTRYSLKGDGTNGADGQERQFPEGAGPEEAVRRFYAEAEGRGQTVRVFQRNGQTGRGTRSRLRLGRFTEVTADEATETAAQTKAELKALGIPAFIHAGDLEVMNKNGEILCAAEDSATINHAAVGIANEIKIAPKETAGHEAYHFWKGSSFRQSYSDLVYSGIKWNSPEFFDLYDHINKNYFDNDYDMDNPKQRRVFNEELVAYISGRLYNGEDLSGLLGNPVAAQSAWETLVEENRDRTTRNRYSLKGDVANGRKEVERGAEGTIQQDHAGGSGGNGQNRTSDGKILGILSLQRMSQGQQPVHSWAEDGLIVPEPGSVADSEAHVIQDEYDLPVFVVKSDIFDQNHATAPAFSAEGQVFLREDLPEIGRKDIGAHEAGHVMKQLGYEPYLNFIRDTPDLINTGTNTARKLLEFAASHTSVDLFSMNKEDVLELYDEINNMVYGAIHAGRTEILELVRPAFFDFDTYATELSEIHEQFKRERGVTQARELRKENGSAGLSQEELRAVQNIGRKSVNDFTAENIKATEFFARQYWEKMGAKSPLFRAWFGDWRANDHTPVERAAELGDAREKVHNEDTGWDINVSGKVFNETRAHTGPANVNARQYLLHLNDIIKKAVLLDSYTMTEGKAKSANSLLMHSMYTVADIGKGPELLKLYVEEMNDPNSKNTTKRAYQLQNIEHQQLNAKGSGRSPSPVISTADSKKCSRPVCRCQAFGQELQPQTGKCGG